MNKSKTVLEWLYTIPVDSTRERAINNYKSPFGYEVREGGVDIKESCLADALVAAFHWGSSPEKEFWQSVNSWAQELYFLEMSGRISDSEHNEFLFKCPVYEHVTPNY